MTTKTATVIAFSAVNRPDGGETVVERLRRGIADAELDCGCRETANDVIDRIGAEAICPAMAMDGLPPCPRQSGARARVNASVTPCRYGG